MKRGQSNLNFIIALNKEPNMTSHDAVFQCRKIFNEQRVGHMGTLDPLASGLLLIGVGKATRLNQFLEYLDKTYTFTVKFGKSTDTYDAEGNVVETHDVPECIRDADFATKYVDNLVGVHNQVPPKHSAIKVNGKRAYKQARSGVDFEMPSRKIEIKQAEIVEIMPDSWKIKTTVSKGTFIRSIAHDIGQDLKCGAYVSELFRDAIGNINCIDAYNLDNLKTDFKMQNLKYVNVVDLLDMPSCDLTEEQLAKLIHGSQLQFNIDKSLKVGGFVCAIMDRKLHGIYKQIIPAESTKTLFAPKCIFEEGIDF